MTINPLKTYHMITGLPRSGSTLLSSILRQNPRFHASITDPLATLVKSVIETSQDGPGMKTEVPQHRVHNLVEHLFEGYYADVDRPVIFNTNRAWTLLTPVIKQVLPHSRMLVCVRDIAWVLDSFEQAHRRNPLSKNSVFGGMSGTVYSRMDSLMEDSGIVGFPLQGIKQAITSNEKHMIMLIDYDLLCKNPLGIMQAVYKFIGQPYFDHDFDNVEAHWDEYDQDIGINNLHTVRKKVEFLSRNMIVPPDILNKYKNLEVWRQ